MESESKNTFEKLGDSSRLAVRPLRGHLSHSFRVSRQQQQQWSLPREAQLLQRGDRGYLFLLLEAFGDFMSALFASAEARCADTRDWEANESGPRRSRASVLVRVLEGLELKSAGDRKSLGGGRGAPRKAELMSC